MRRTSPSLPHRRALARPSRPWPPGPRTRPREPADLLLRHLDRIEAPAADRLRRAAELAERVAHAVEQLRRARPRGTSRRLAAVLLVAQHREDEVAARLQLAARRARNASTSIATPPFMSSAPRPQTHAVDELAAERRVRPLLAGRRDDVDVAVEQERRRLARAGHARDQVRPRRRPSRRCASRRLRRRASRFMCATHALLVAGRVRRVEADQVAQQLDDVHVIASSASTSRSTSAVVL